MGKRELSLGRGLQFSPTFQMRRRPGEYEALGLWKIPEVNFMGCLCRVGIFRWSRLFHKS